MPIESLASPSPLADTVNPAAYYVLEPMRAWSWNWASIQDTLSHYQSSLWWLGIVLVAIFILGTQLIFFPLCYRVMKMQATTSMRLSYLVSLFLATIVFHWWLWRWIFVSLLKSYWLWLAWCLFGLGWLALIIWTPKRRQDA